MSWQSDKRSSESEVAVVEYLSRYFQATSYERSRQPEYDVCFVLPHGSKRFCEIKTDFKAEHTGNIYLEIRNTCVNKPSGLTVTTADIWVHYVPYLKRLWGFDPKALLWYLQIHSQYRGSQIWLSTPGSGDKNSQGYIVPLAKVMQWEWPIQIPIDIEV